MTLKQTFTIIALTATACLGSASAQGRGRGGPAAPIKITIPAFADGGTIPAKYGCANGTNGNISPAIQWSGLPEGTVTVALILHDPDLMIGDNDVLHWAIFNIPATATGLPEGVATTATLPDGSVQLQNIGRSLGYFNPCAPPPTTHHYIFEIFALDTKLDPAPASRADLLKAMIGHVKAKGTWTGQFHQ